MNPEVTLPVDSLSTASTTAPALSFTDLLFEGGWVMIPILILSIVALAFFVERFLALRAAKFDLQALIVRLRSYVHSGDLKGALGYCEAQDKPVTRILHQGLERLGRPITEITDAVEVAGKEETFLLTKRMDAIASVAALAPMLGFLGTVTGMISAFQQIQALEGNVNPSVLAGGIWEALLTTAAGLAVGILALFMYNYLQGQLARRAHDLEIAAARFIDMLQEPAEGPTSRASY